MLSNSGTANCSGAAAGAVYGGALVLLVRCKRLRIHTAADDERCERRAAAAGAPVGSERQKVRAG